MKKPIAIFIAVLASLTALLGNLVNLESALETLLDSKLFAYGFVVWDLAGAELVFVAAILLFRRPLSSAITRGAAAAYAQFAKGDTERTLIGSLFAAAAVVALVALTGYHLYYLAVGKYLMWTLHQTTFVRRASDEFLRGHSSRALMLLRVCNGVYDFCHETDARVRKRLEEASAVRSMAQLLPPGSLARPSYAVAAYALDRRWDLYQESVSAAKRDFDRAAILWRHAVNAIHVGQLPQAEGYLTELQSVWSGFADSHTALERLRGGRTDLFVDVVRRMGVEQYVEETIAPFVPRGLSRRALSPLEQQALPGGLAASRRDEYGFERPTSFATEANRIASIAGFEPSNDYQFRNEDDDEESPGEQGVSEEAARGRVVGDESAESVPPPPWAYSQPSHILVAFNVRPAAQLDYESAARTLLEDAGPMRALSGQTQVRLFRDVATDRSRTYLWLIGPGQFKNVVGSPVEHALRSLDADTSAALTGKLMANEAIETRAVLPLKLIERMYGRVHASCGWMTVVASGVSARAALYTVDIPTASTGLFEQQWRSRSRSVARCFDRSGPATEGDGIEIYAAVGQSPRPGLSMYFAFAAPTWASFVPSQLFAKIPVVNGIGADAARGAHATLTPHMLERVGEATW
jgi:hypothetical protein